MKLGSLSTKYKVSGDPGAVSIGRGGAGGVFYGTYHLAGNTGDVGEFIGWLQSRGHYSGNILSQHPPGSREFSAAWKFCAENYTDFGELQHRYIKWSYENKCREAPEGLG